MTLIKLRDQPALRVVPPYYDDPVYIEALAASIEAELQTAAVQARADPRVVPRHPEILCRRGRSLSDAIARRRRGCCAQRLKLDESKLMLTFQSRFGRAEWLQPYTDKTVEALAQARREEPRGGDAGIFRRLPGDAGGDRGRERAISSRRNGGENFAAIPCLNDSEAGMAVICHVVLRELQGWI